MRVRPDVEILRPTAEDEIANASAYQVGDMIILLQPMQHPERIRIDVPPRNRMAFARDDDGFWHED
jgi:hypothetical protein